MRLKSWQSLLFKVRHLSLEVEDRMEQIREHSAEFERRVLNEMGEAPPVETKVSDAGEQGIVPSPGPMLTDHESPQNTGRTADPLSQEAKAGESPSMPESARKLWRAIALKTHPDRVGKDNELGQLYRTASAAWNDGNLAGLIGVALELGMAIEPDESFYGALRAIADQTEEKLGSLESMAVWQWLQADEEDRDEVVKRTSQIVSAKRRS